MDIYTCISEFCPIPLRQYYFYFANDIFKCILLNAICFILLLLLLFIILFFLLSFLFCLHNSAALQAK